MYHYNATVVRVIDGDTVALNVDLGFRTWHESPFRLYGIDAPEVGAAGTEGEEARVFLRDLLPPGQRVVAQTQRSADKYGRWLATVWVAGDELSVNERMVDAGHARPYDGGPR